MLLVSLVFISNSFLRQNLQTVRGITLEKVTGKLGDCKQVNFRIWLSWNSFLDSEDWRFYSLILTVAHAQDSFLWINRLNLLLASIISSFSSIKPIIFPMVCLILDSRNLYELFTLGYSPILWSLRVQF